MNYKQMRQELQQGQTIEEVCSKHHCTFKRLFNHFKGYERNKTWRENTTMQRVDKYIDTRNGTYAIRKSGNMYGTYNSLEDATLVRDALEEDGWHQTHVDSICEELGVKRRKGYINEKVRYH